MPAPLISGFRAVYQEVLGLETQLAPYGAGAAPGSGSTGDESTPGASDSRLAPLTPAELQVMREPLVEAIRALMKPIPHASAAETTTGREAAFLATVFADDRFTGAGSPETALWDHHRLEAELFGSSLGVDEIYSRIELLLAAGERADPELARLYLTTLFLGFRDEAEPGRRAQDRERLLGRVFQGQRPLRPDKEPIFAAAYRATDSNERLVLLPNLRRWAALALAALLALTLISSYREWRETRGVAKEVGKILESQR